MSGARDAGAWIAALAVLAVAAVGALALAGAGPFGADRADDADDPPPPLADLAPGRCHEAVPASPATGGRAVAFARAEDGRLVIRIDGTNGRPATVGGCAEPGGPVGACGGVAVAAPDDTLALAGPASPVVASAEVQLDDGATVAAVVGDQGWLALVEGGPTADDTARAGPRPEDVVARDAGGEVVGSARFVAD